MRSSKSYKSVVALVEAINGSGLLRQEQHQAITQALKELRQALRSRNRSAVNRTVNEISKNVIDAIIKDQR